MSLKCAKFRHKLSNSVEIISQTIDLCRKMAQYFRGENNMEMLKAEIAGLIGQFKTIINLANTIKVEEETALSDVNTSKLKALVEEFNSLVYEAASVGTKLGSHFYLSSISPLEIIDGLEGYFCGPIDAQRAITQIQSRSSKAIAFLEKVMMPTLSKEQMDELKSLRKELEKVNDINCQKNLLKSIEESEQAHHLASALIASRVIVYVLEKIPGKKDEEKVNNLFQKGLIPEKREDVKSSLLRACRLTRNTLSHRIEIFPDPAEALSILANSITLSKLESNFQSAFQNL